MFRRPTSRIPLLRMDVEPRSKRVVFYVETAEEVVEGEGPDKKT